jgi:hypothetical protein
LTGLKALRALSLVETNVTEAGARRLSDALPQCQITLTGGVTIGPKDKSVTPPPPVEDDFPEPPVDVNRRAVEMLHAHTTVMIRLPDGRTLRIAKTDKVPDGPLVVSGVIATDLELDKVDDFMTKFLLSAVLPLDSLEQLSIGAHHFPLDEKQMAQMAAAPFAPNLRVLQVAVELNSNTIGWLKKFPKLKEIECLTNQADDADLSRLKEVPGLRILALRGLGQTGHVTNRGYEALAAMTLTRLRLGGDAKIDAAGLRCLTTMPELSEFLLQTSATDDLLIEVANFPRLKYLSLAFSPGITDAGLAHLTRMKTLRSLSLESTKVTESGARKLSDALPQCQIILAAGAKIGPKDKSVKPPPPEEK